jgi:hypothetical protein
MLEHNQTEIKICLDLNLTVEQNLEKWFLNYNAIVQRRASVIDFNYASNEWRKNKIYRGNGVFSYKCGAQTKSGKICKKSVETCLIKSHIKSR